ncbi:MAG: cytochrome c3 family protein [Gemmatimonadota bacterium]|jgi:predicted CXXCH cytochrome family protein|nr:cytochrome c3 family protein [Gemmatimonadota bacterium]MDP7030682.1 cytochrome c3 family protein [Gemmatimonadota bacterium]
MLNRWLPCLLVLLVAAFVAGCADNDDDCITPDPVPAMDYAGSAACATCHSDTSSAGRATGSDEYDRWVESGHPYKLTKIDGVAPTDKFPTFSRYPNDPVDPPTGTWADYSYTIGGYGWKMRWVKNDGFIQTDVGSNQYNFESGAYSDYHVGEEKPYNCGKCHTTGWVDSDDGDATNNQEGMAGMTGTFVAPGVHCEECHGTGSQHVSDPELFPMTVDASSDQCGRCHTRHSTQKIQVSSGFIKHHEQYDEWLHSPHKGYAGCNDCHDPHSSVVFDDEALGMGVTTTCEDCHSEVVTIAGHDLLYPGTVGCTDCHMPEAAKSAVKENDYNGDVMSHIFQINTDAVGKDAMFYDDGGTTFVVVDEGGVASVTLDFACYGCHQDSSGTGGLGSMKTLAELSAQAVGIHD